MVTNNNKRLEAKNTANDMKVVRKKRINAAFKTITTYNFTFLQLLYLFMNGIGVHGHRYEPFIFFNSNSKFFNSHLSPSTQSLNVSNKQSFGVGFPLPLPIKDA